MEEFKEALKNCDEIKVVLTGVGETVFTTEEIHRKILELEKLNSNLKSQVKYWRKLGTQCRNDLKKIKNKEDKK